MIGRRMRAVSGGPTLVIDRIISDRLVACSWMDPMGQRQSGTLRLNTLEAIDDVRPMMPATAQAGHFSVYETLRNIAARLRIVSRTTTSARL